MLMSPAETARSLSMFERSLDLAWLDLVHTSLARSTGGCGKQLSVPGCRKMSRDLKSLTGYCKDLDIFMGK